MDSIAVTKPNMAVLSQERLALSPFGALAQSFAEELMARAGQEEGYWSFVPLELLQEAEEPPVSPVPPAQTVLQFNLKLVLDALRKDRPSTEYLRATERIVERIVQRQEVQREAARSAPAAAAAVAPAATAQAALRFQQNIMQTLHQTFLFRRPDGYRAGEGFRQQPGAAAGETGRPGQLGQKTAVFTQMLQTLREEGKSFPAQQAAEQTAIPAQRPKYPAAGDQILPLLTHLEEGEQAAETAQQGGAQAAKRLIQTAEQLERKLRQKDVRPTKTQTIQQTQHTPVSQHTGPEQGHDLPKFSARQGGEPTGSLHTLEPPSLKEQSEISRAVERAVRTVETLLPQMETQRQTSAKPLTEQPPGKEVRTVTAKDIRAVIPDSDNQERRPEQHRADFLPSEEPTHRQEEPGREATAPPTAMTQPHSAQPHVEPGQKVTARDIRTVISESGEQTIQPERRSGELLPGEELTHRQEEPGSEATTPPTAMTQPHSAQPHVEAGQKVTARGIRTVIPESGEQASQPRQRLGEILPGEELTHRQEEPGSEATTPPTAMIQPHSAQPHAKPGQKVTARDIRTVISESGEQMTQPEQRQVEFHSDIELAHRAEEQKDEATQAAAQSQPHTAKEIHSAAGAGVTAQENRQCKRKVKSLSGLGTDSPKEKETNQTAQISGVSRSAGKIQPTTARDIRTAVIGFAGREGNRDRSKVKALSGDELIHRLEGQSEEYLQPSVASRTMETQLAQGTLSGEELTLKTEQSTAAPPPAEAFERATVGQQVSVGKPIAGTLQGDIRIGQRLMGRSNLLPETGNRRDIPSAAVPSVALEYGTHVQGQQGEQPPVPARNDVRQAGNTAGQQPLELTYSPGQQAVSQVQTSVQPQAPQPPEESDSVRSLPDWARRFLRDSWTAAPAAQEIGVARQIATLPEQSTEMVEWSAPNYKPNVPLEHREKRKEERPQKPQQIHLSEAEIQRAADRVYRILEDRIREERIRLGF